MPRLAKARPAAPAPSQCQGAIISPMAASAQDVYKRQLSRGEQPIEAFDPSGIPPLEGARALTRILLARTPLAVVAVSQPLEELNDRNVTPSSGATNSTTASSAPTEGIEATLAGLWQDLLGVDQVGLDDDFFGLGGHSLVGVRLFAKIKKTYQVDLDVAVLFEARTVRQLAGLIRKAQQPAGLQSKAWSALVPIQPVSYTHLDVYKRQIEIRSIAGGLLVAQADVTNLDQMRDAVALAGQHYGKLDGVFHAAGILDDGPLMLKSAESAARVLDPKVRGTLVLEEALRDAPLSCFVLFSSISSIFPPAGQVDYAAANAFLDAFALSRKDPVTVINWGAWREVGMGARSASPHPLLEEKLLATPREIVYSSQFSQQKQWLLSEHRLKTGMALIPGTGYLEMAAGAFARGTFHGAIEFQDVFFLAPLTFDASESREVRVQLRREQEAGPEKGAFHFSMFARAGEWVEHSTGNIAPCLANPATHVDRAAIVARCRQREIVFDEQHRTKQERYFEFGPRWHCLKRLHIGKQEGLAELELDDRFSADCAAYRMHPALLDLATGCSLYLTDGYESSDDLYLPFSYKKLCLHRPLPSKLFSHIRPRKENLLHGEVETFDITLFDEQGQVLAEIEGFSMRRVADPAKAPEENASAHDAALSRGEQPIEAFDPCLLYT